MLLLFLSRGFDNLLELDDKGDVSIRDNGSGLGRFSRLIQISAERLADITKNNFSLYYNRANLRLVEDLEHISCNEKLGFSLDSPLSFTLEIIGLFITFGRSPRVRVQP
ncbi:hypothetical protein GQ457_07G007810 [Hibiscus cannabinus]